MRPCYNCHVINYSRQDVEKQLVADQALWQRVAFATAALLWPLEVALLGWHLGWWLGAITVVLSCFASVIVPSRLKLNIYWVDLLDRAARLPVDLFWLLLVWHLWMREPIFIVLGQPLFGAILISTLLWLAARLLTIVTRHLVQRCCLGGLD